LLPLFFNKKDIFVKINLYFVLKKNIFKKLPSFNLQEMLIVLAIIGILLLIALPNLMPLITKAKSVEAQVQLKAIYNAEKQYYFMYSKYSPNFSEIDFEAPKTTKENGSANYVYEIIQSDNNIFKVKATAITDFNGNGVFNVWEIDQNGVPKQIIND
jgi:type IV pilus assembly protein PilE